MFHARPAIALTALLLTAAACAGPRPQPAPQPLLPAPPGAIAAGSVVLVRTTQSIDSRQQGAGSRFTATLEADLVADDATVVAKRGSTVYAQLAAARSAGRLAGRSEMTIELTGILLGERLVPISSSSVTAVGEGAARDTARRAGAGALIGGTFDGSKGARRGAAIGVGLSAMSSGGHIAIPSGTILQFQLADHLVR